MSKKVVSIEDRIPKLKQARKKKANRRLIFYISLFFVLISIVVYLQSPLSHIQNIDVSGNTYVTNEEIQSLSGVVTGDNFWSINTEEAQANISKHQEIKSVEVNKSFPTTVTIKVVELQRVGYVQDSTAYYPILENGIRLTSYPLESVSGDAPILIGFNKQTYLEEISKELSKTPSNIVDLVSEIIWEPTEGNPYKLRVFMNDGFEVEGSIRNFSTVMRSYPSITAQLEPNSRGVIRIGVGGAVFDPFDDKEVEVKTPEIEENQNEIEG